MDLSALSTRLTALSLAPAPQEAAATPVLSYFFTPKSGSKHPDNAEQDLKLVVVALEEAKNVGAAKAVAASVGLKDMRAISGADLEKLLGRKREEGEFCVLSPLARCVASPPRARVSNSFSTVEVAQAYCICPGRLGARRYTRGALAMSSRVSGAAGNCRERRVLSCAAIHTRTSLTSKDKHIFVTYSLTHQHPLAASPLSVPPTLAPSTLILTSDSLSSLKSLSFPSPVEPETTLTVTFADWTKVIDSFKIEGAAVKELEFQVKGAEAP